MLFFLFSRQNGQGGRGDQQAEERPEEDLHQPLTLQSAGLRGRQASIGARSLDVGGPLQGQRQRAAAEGHDPLDRPGDPGKLQQQ